MNKKLFHISATLLLVALNLEALADEHKGN